MPRPGRLLGLDDTRDGKRPKWRLSLLDLEHAGSWSWSVDEDALRKIIVFLTEMERLTWTQIKMQIGGSGHKKHHSQLVDTLCPEARRRLRELQLDDFDEMFRFRVGSALRLWGILDDDVFYPVWWDAGHQVYPMDN